jgi:hypothetical protein
MKDQTSIIEDTIVLRLKSRPKNFPSFKSLIVLSESETKINSKLPYFDIFYVKKLNNYKIIIKQLKKLNRRNIGIEIKIKDIRSCNSDEVGKWVKSIKEINKFCKLNDNQLIISSGAETNYETISGNTFESLLGIFDIEPLTYWRELEEWIDIKSGVYSGAS